MGIKKSKEYDFPIIAVGNLCVGGTGKSPMVEYLIRLLKAKARLATLSRGYKRESKGFQLVLSSSTAREVGDEPLQFKIKYNDVLVGVDGDRQNGIANLRSTDPRPEVIILDDAYQHRKVKAGFYILLTSYYDLYCNDIVLPTGNLREPRKGANRANIVIVTKCPNDISTSEMKAITEKLNIHSEQSLFFSTIDYGDKIVGTTKEESIDWLQNKSFVLVTGIANPKPLIEYYTSLGLTFNHISFPDHHNFTDKELKDLAHHDIIVTTEKDYVRLISDFSGKSLWYQPIEMKFIKNGSAFDDTLFRYIKK
ncbi:tetraacyldisaccharide 4'-kinase [Aquimarina mytili]